MTAIPLPGTGSSQPAMPGDEPIEHGIEFRRPLPFDRRARWPDYENISRTVHERTATQGRTDDPSLQIQLRILGIHLAGVIFEATRISRPRSKDQHGHHRAAAFAGD